MIGYNDFNIYSSGFHKPNIKWGSFLLNKLKTLINFSTEKNDLFAKIFEYNYLLKVSRCFPTKMTINMNPKRINTRVLVFKIKTEKIFVTLNLLPIVF
jgi:hypothetical protein